MQTPRVALILLASAGSLVFAQRLDPVQWSLMSEVGQAPPGSAVPLHLTATIQSGWHLYSLTTPAGGAIPTTAALAESPAVENATIFQPKPERRFDPNFGVDTETFTGETVFLVSTRLK